MSSQKVERLFFLDLWHKHLHDQGKEGMEKDVKHEKGIFNEVEFQRSFKKIGTRVQVKGNKQI